MWALILIGFLLAFYVGASIVRSIHGYQLPPLSDDEKYKTIKERIQ